MGYRCEIRVDDELYPAMFVLDYMLGGYFNSTLIEEIREKRSLAYSVYSSYYSNKGSFIITGGISSSEYEEFKKVSISIINDYKKGIINDENFTNAKKILVNAQYRAADEMNYGMAEIIKEISGGIMRTTEEKVDIIKNVTKEEIIKAAFENELKPIVCVGESLEERELLQEKYYVETLDNGLKVILIPKNDFYTSYAILSVKYGSKDTEFIPYGKTEMVKSPEGIAHFLEHKLFECDEGVDVTNQT